MPKKENGYYPTIWFEMVRWGLTALGIAFIYSLSLAVETVTESWAGSWIGWGAALALSILFVYAGLEIFPSDPPTGWIPKVFGRYVNRLKGVGPTWIPFKSALTLGFTKLTRKTVHIELKPKEMIPGDRVSIEIPIGMWAEVDPDNPAMVIKLGGLERAFELLREDFEKALRQWVTTPDAGPEKIGKDQKKTLDRIRQMNTDAINYLLEEMAHDDIVPIPYGFSAEALIGHFECRILSVREKSEVNKFLALNPARKAEVERAVKQRMDEIEAVRLGKKPICIKSTGLRVTQIIIGNMEPDSASMKYADAVAKANFDAEIKEINANAVAKQAEILKKHTTSMDPVQASMTLNGTIKQTVETKKFELGESTGKVFAGLGELLFAGLFGRKEKDNGGNTGAHA